MDDDQEAVVRAKFEALVPVLNEAVMRLWAAAEARALGRGGISLVARATGLARNTIASGLREFEDPALRTALAQGRVRRPGAGPKALTTTHPELADALERLVAPATRGDPMSPLRWSSKSTEKLASELSAEGFPISADTVGRMLVTKGYGASARLIDPFMRTSDAV